jgi:hypothetical protein
LECFERVECVRPLTGRREPASFDGASRLEGLRSFGVDVEAVAAARESLNRVFHATLAQGRAQQAHGALQRAFRNDGAVPQLGQELVLRYYALAVTREVNEKVEHERLQRLDAAIESQRATGLVELETTEGQRHGVDAYPRALCEQSIRNWSGCKKDFATTMLQVQRVFGTGVSG